MSSGKSADAADYEELLREAELERDAADDRVRLLEEEVEFARLESEELQDLLDRALRHNRYLMAQPQPTEVPETTSPEPRETVADCLEVLEAVQAELPGVCLGGDTAAGAGDLDKHGKRSAWARKAWTALLALQQYTEAKADGFEGDFRRYAKESGACPTSWIALQESETTNNDTRYRAVRTFPVEDGVDPAGTAFMPSHIKLDNAPPAPRIHFYDDTDGTTGRVHVGWFGEHRKNSSTN